ncbi:MAG: hypothetical protein QF364_06690 [Candidatus Poseidoniaceae archaeon]|nr:hypothetical protein [Candidatus Poseidoniaceae archaeon]
MQRAAMTVPQATAAAAFLYAVLFAGHIFTAAQNHERAFQVVASLITVMTFSVAIWIQIIGKFSEIDQKVRANTTGFVFGLPLSVGLSWAYSEQSFDVGTTILFLVVTTFTHSVHRILILRNKA